MPQFIEKPRPVAPYHLANLDVLRALAVIGVIFWHIKSIMGYSFPFLGDFGGLLGVQLFFLISGYLITESATKHTVREYVLHRFFRIFPVYWAVYLGFGLAEGFFLNGNTEWFYVGLNLFNLQQFSPRALIEYDVLHVSWTLTVESMWYIFAPLLVLSKRTMILPILFGSAILSTLWSYFAATGALNPLFAGGFSAMSWQAQPGQVRVIVNNAFPAQAVFFIIGSTIYYYRDILLKINSSILGLLIVLFLLMVGVYHFALPTPIFLTGIGLLAFFVALLRSPPSSNWLLIRIGKISYSIYLIHFSVILWVNHALAGTAKLVAMSISLIAIFALANVMYEFIEKPFIRLGRNISNKWS